jgi:hypothetical protein
LIVLIKSSSNICVLERCAYNGATAQSSASGVRPPLKAEGLFGS